MGQFIFFSPITSSFADISFYKIAFNYSIRSSFIKNIILKINICTPLIKISRRIRLWENSFKKSNLANI